MKSTFYPQRTDRWKTPFLSRFKVSLALLLTNRTIQPSDISEPLMHYQAAFQQSVFQHIHDELFAYLLLFFSTEELQTLSLVNSGNSLFFVSFKFHWFVGLVFYIFTREEPMWMLHCLTQHGGNFLFQTSWRWTTMRPRHRCTRSLSPSRVNFPTFESPFLTGRWYRCHMSLHNLNLDWIQPARDALAVVDIDTLEDPVAFYQ